MAGSGGNGPRGRMMREARMADLLAEVARFREWAVSYHGPRGGEWECGYDR